MIVDMMALKPREDPDAQTTVNDFQDYTDFLPSDVTRSLSLIGKLDSTYLDRADSVHRLAEQYGQAPKLPLAQKPDLERIRSTISYNLNHAILARESAYGEAVRLHEMVDRHYKRLANISSKLQALPKPPSRDPTPVPRSPQNARKTPTRITLRLDGTRHAATTSRPSGQPARNREKKRRITIPGEVLPPPNPDSPISFTASDWDSPPQSPLPMPTSRVGSAQKARKPIRIRPPKPPKIPKERTPRPPRPPGMGTNVHSQVAGISTSNALSLIPAPPPDAKAGSEHAPWMRLTEYEMAKLRKRMKKNAIWTPSETMIRRELADAGRGPENYRLKKSEAEEKGVAFLDEDNIADMPPGRALLPGEISADSLGEAESNLSNRGMKLNEAKKLKREAALAASAEEMKAAANRVADLGSNFRDLFSNPPKMPLGGGSPSATVSPVQKDRQARKDHKSKDRIREDQAGASKDHKKRKREDEDGGWDATPLSASTAAGPVSPFNTDKPSKKKQKVAGEHSSPTAANVTAETMTATIPLVVEGVVAASTELDGQRNNVDQSNSNGGGEPSELTTLTTSSSEVPAAGSAMSAPEKPNNIPKLFSSATASRSRRISLTLKGPSERPPAPPAIQTAPLSGSSRSASSLRASSSGPASATLPRSDHQHGPLLRLGPPASPSLATTARSSSAAGGTARRSKRPAPGAVVKDQDGGATVSVGKRPHAPKKSSAARHHVSALDTTQNQQQQHQQAQQQQPPKTPVSAGPLEEIDPNEPRYCVCGDVSYGDMIGCDNEDCEKEWFHFACVGLTANLPRRQKWYCPDCKALGFGIKR